MQTSAYKQMHTNVNAGKISSNLSSLRHDYAGTSASKMIVLADATDSSKKSISRALRDFSMISKVDDADVFVRTYLANNHDKSSILNSSKIVRLYLQRFPSSTNGPVVLTDLCSYLQVYDFDAAVYLLCKDFAQLPAFQLNAKFLIKCASICEYTKKTKDAKKLLDQAFRLSLSPQDNAEATLIKALVLRDNGDKLRAKQTLADAKRLAEAANDQFVLQMCSRLTLKGHSMDPDILTPKKEVRVHRATSYGIIGLIVSGGILVVVGIVLFVGRRRYAINGGN
jgi:tetratricopeptide (TPR) repeat protein